MILAVACASGRDGFSRNRCRMGSLFRGADAAQNAPSGGAMPHKSTLDRAGCRMSALFKRPNAACLPDDGARIAPDRIRKGATLPGSWVRLFYYSDRGGHE